MDRLKWKWKRRRSKKATENNKRSSFNWEPHQSFVVDEAQLSFWFNATFYTISISSSYTLWLPCCRVKGKLYLHFATPFCSRFRFGLKVWTLSQNGFFTYCQCTWTRDTKWNVSACVERCLGFFYFLHSFSSCVLTSRVSFLVFVIPELLLFFILKNILCCNRQN